MEEEIVKLGNKVKIGEISWHEAAKTINKQYGVMLSSEAIRKRYKRLSEMTTINKEEETYNQDGSIEIEKKIWFDEDEVKSPETILIKFGYDPKMWELITWTFGKWEVALKDEKINRVCTTIRAKIKPIDKKYVPVEEYVKEAQKVFEKEIIPIKIPISKHNKELDKDKLLELGGIELHLGKMSWSGETGQDYDKNIAQERFYTIYEEVIEQQRIEKCDTCLVCIGNDFFNSDTVNATTTKGTPQTNDLRWQKLFNIGLKLYTQMLDGLSKEFNHIEVRLQSGNHDKMASFYLYIALKCYFKNYGNIRFNENYKDVQSFIWGKCGIFFSHGDSNLKRLIKSIPAEFYKEWGKTIYRELHLGHLHKEVVVDDESGMITRRIGSPTAIDQWHYEERFIGATQKYQTFVWHKEKGLQNIKYITFSDKKKQKVKKYESSNRL